MPRFSACGKFILSGEHFILYGSPALALPWLDAVLSLSFSAEPWPPLQPSLLPEAPLLLEAWRKACRLVGRPDPTFWPFRLTSTIPLGSGFGSSAALCVALLQAATSPETDTALVQNPPPAPPFFDPRQQEAPSPSAPLALSELLAYATELEAVFHGRSSGLDPAVVVHRQPLRFLMGHPPKPLAWKLEGYGFVLAATPVARQTSQAIQRVRDLAQAHPTEFSDLRDKVASIVEQVTACIGEATEPDKAAHRMGPLLTQNHAILAHVGVSSPALDRLVQTALDHGALGAKLTGAGLGGGVLAWAKTSDLPAIRDGFLSAQAHAVSIYHPR